MNLARIDIGKTRVIFWDLGGQTTLRPLWNRYYREASALLFVVDSTDLERFEESRATFGMFFGFDLITLIVITAFIVESLLKHPDLQHIPILIFANKQDLDVQTYFIVSCFLIF